MTRATLFQAGYWVRAGDGTLPAAFGGARQEVVDRTGIEPVTPCCSVAWAAGGANDGSALQRPRRLSHGWCSEARRSFRPDARCGGYTVAVKGGLEEVSQGSAAEPELHAAGALPAVVTGAAVVPRLLAGPGLPVVQFNGVVTSVPAGVGLPRVRGENRAVPVGPSAIEQRQRTGAAGADEPRPLTVGSLNPGGVARHRREAQHRRRSGRGPATRESKSGGMHPGRPCGRSAWPHHFHPPHAL